MNDGLWWLAAAATLAGAELLIPGVFLIFLAIAAAITGVAALALPLPLVAQLGSFAAWSVIAVLIGRRWYTDYPVQTSDPLLNDRAARLIGEVVTVVTPIADGRGRVRVGDGEWIASGPAAAAGARVRITACAAGVLTVEPVEPPTRDAADAPRAGGNEAKGPDP